MAAASAKRGGPSRGPKYVSTVAHANAIVVCPEGNDGSFGAAMSVCGSGYRRQGRGRPITSRSA